jgi:hypothetical protein
LFSSSCQAGDRCPSRRHYGKLRYNISRRYINNKYNINIDYF